MLKPLIYNHANYGVKYKMGPGGKPCGTPASNSGITT